MKHMQVTEIRLYSSFKSDYRYPMWDYTSFVFQKRTSSKVE